MIKWIMTLWLVPSIFALSLEQAIESALNNNTDYQIQLNRNQQSLNSETLGYTKLLPSLEAIATGVYQEYDEIYSANNTRPQSQELYSAGLSSQWILFDGFQTWATQAKLKKLSQIEMLKTEDMESLLVIQVKRDYFKLGVLLSNQNWWSEQYQSSLTQFQIIESKEAYGSMRRKDFLQSKIQLKNDSLAWAKSQLELKSHWEEFLQLTGLTLSEVPANVSQEKLNWESQFEPLQLEKNLKIRMLKNQYQYSKQSTSSSASSFYPHIVAHGKYMYNFNEGEFNTGAIASEYRLKEIGLSLKWNLFNGLQDQMDYRNSKLNEVNAGLAVKEAHSEIEMQYTLALERFKMLESSLKLAQDQTELAEELLKLSEESYQLGSLTQFELRQAKLEYQKSWLNLQNQKLQTYELTLQIQNLLGN